MKALLIDDEPPVITVVKLLVDWEKHGIDTVLEAGNAEDALTLIESEHPEIILSDINLPGLSGLDLIGMLKEKDPGAKVIVISAFDKFAYAQRAVELGCVEYLLKPIKRDTVNRAVEKAVMRYREDMRLQEESTISRIPATLSLFLSSGYEEDVLRDLAELAPWMKGWHSVRVGVIAMSHFSGESPVIYQIQEILHRTITRKQSGTAALWGSSRELVLLLDGSILALPARCQTFLSEIQNTYGTIVSMGLSGPRDYPAGIDAAYREAQEIAVSIDLRGGGGSVRMSAAAAPPIVAHEWIEKMMFAGFPEVSGQRIRQTLMDLGRQVDQAENICVRQLENFRSLYNSARSRSIMNFLREQNKKVQAPASFTGSFCLPDGRFEGDYFSEMLYQDMMALQKQYRPESVPVTISEICDAAKRYLEAHYREEISLEELAKRYGVSASYLSRSFKKETGSGMNEYLTAIRIKKACELLRGGMRAADAGAAVGFDDPKYFSRVFKKATGTSPSEYREKE